MTCTKAPYGRGNIFTHSANHAAKGDRPKYDDQLKRLKVNSKSIMAEKTKECSFGQISFEKHPFFEKCNKTLWKYVIKYLRASKKENIKVQACSFIDGKLSRALLGDF